MLIALAGPDNLPDGPPDSGDAEEYDENGNGSGNNSALAGATLAMAAANLLALSTESTQDLGRLMAASALAQVRGGLPIHHHLQNTRTRW